MTTSPRVLAVALALGAALLVAFVRVGPAVAAPSTYEIDPAHSTAMFKVKHMDVSHVYGRFDDFSGRYLLDADAPDASSVELTIQTASVDTNNEKRDQHLRSADFFDVEQYPEMTFKSTKVEKAGTDAWNVTGDLTLHGVTKPVQMKVVKTGEIDDPRVGHRTGFEGSTTIERSRFGMTGGIPGVSDTVWITIAVEGQRQ